MVESLRETLGTLTGRALRVLAAPAVAPRRSRGSASASVVERLVGGTIQPAPARHPLTPAAIRIERSRADNRSADQLAVTMWFGEGPQLPVPGQQQRSEAARMLTQVGASLLGALALAALSSAAARVQQREASLNVPARLRPAALPPLTRLLLGLPAAAPATGQGGDGPPARR